MSFIIVHNPRCSKSREALQLLEAKGIKPKVVDYLNGGLTRELLTIIISALNVRPKDILRTKEDEFEALALDVEDDAATFDAILAHPKLLERPIVLYGKAAVIGRPPENILKLLSVTR